jgi:hypothetical protein
MIKNKNIIRNFTENLLIFIIFLSLTGIFIEEFLKFTGSNGYLMTVQFFNIIFDVIFTVEFFLRTIFAVARKQTREYFFYKRGWIDFLASIPILCLISLPVFIKTFYNIDSPSWLFGIPNSILLFKFTRILKLIKVIKYKNSVLFQKQISSISIIITLSIIFFLSGISFLQENHLLFNTYTDARQSAFINLIYFFMILFIISCISLFYGRQFRIYIFHPISEILKGFEDFYYTKDVKIPKIHNNDEISMLADNYNKRWLPAKIRKIKEIKSKGLTVVNTSRKGKQDEY